MALSAKTLDGEKAASKVISEWNTTYVSDACNAANQIGSIHAGGLLSYDRAKNLVEINFDIKKVDPKHRSTVHGAFENGRCTEISLQEVKDRYFPSHDNDNDEPEEDSIINPPPALIDAFDVSIHGGVFQSVSQYILDTARVPVPEFATIAAITFLSAFYGRRYLTPTELGLNIYMIGIAGPGFGKDHPRGVIEILFHDAKVPWFVGPRSVTSDSSIEKTVRRRPCFVMPWDEVGMLFQSMNDKNASWAKSIRKSILELYSNSAKVWTGKEKADEKTDSSGTHVWFPTVSILGFSTPTEFYAGINEQNLSDGFMARLTIIEGKRQSAKMGDQYARHPPRWLNCCRRLMSWCHHQ
jgi:hypothetical protein